MPKTPRTLGIRPRQTKFSPLQVAEQAIEFLRGITDHPPLCTREKDGSRSPVEDCECFCCKIAREALNIVERYDGEDV